LAWWLMEGEGEGSFSPLLIFPQTTLLRPSFFSFDIKVLLYHGSRPLFMHSFLFPWPINHDCVFWCRKSPTHSLPIQFDWRSLFFSLKLWCRVWPRLTGLKLCKWMKSRPWNHL
jgi:hypothetical protein